jgi:hypothetical protein
MSITRLFRGRGAIATRRYLPIILIIGILSHASCRRVLLDERFSDNRLLRWTIVDDPAVVEGPSRWEVGSDGWLHQRSNIWGRRGDFIGRWYGTLLVSGSERWDDYQLTVRARPGDDDGFGVVFRYFDPEHFYRLIFVEDGLNGGPITRLDKRDGADYTELWSIRAAYHPGSEMVIQIEAVGAGLSGSLDGRVLFDVTDSSYRTGKIGLFCYAQSGQAFDDVRVVSR